MKLSVFGRILIVVQEENKWNVYCSGNEGKIRLADDIKIPSEIQDKEIIEYIADICHEWASKENSEVKIIG